MRDSVQIAKAYTVAEAKAKMNAAVTLFSDCKSWGMLAAGIWEDEKGELVFLLRPTEVTEIISRVSIKAIVDDNEILLRMPANKPSHNVEIPFISFQLNIG